MTKHTPGPWAVSEDGFIYGADQTMVADPHCEDQDHAEREANARLIAAAPEMLGALIRAESALSDYIERLEKTPMTKLYYGHECLTAVRSAIAKAEGRS